MFELYFKTSWIANLSLMASPFVLTGGSGVNLQGGRVRREWGVGHFIFFVFLFCFGDAVTSWTVQAHYTMPYVVLIKVLGGNLIPKKNASFLCS